MKKTITLLSLASIMLTVGCRRETPVNPPNQQAKPAGAEGVAPKGSAASPETANAKDFNATLTQKLTGYAADNLDGSKFTLASLRGKAVLVNVWATWCGPCRFEIPELKSLQTAQSPNGLEVIGISVDDAGARKSVADFVKEQQMNYRVLHDAEGTIATVMQTSVIPTSALLDRKGNVLWYGYGALNTKDAEFQAALKKALAS